MIERVLFAVVFGGRTEFFGETQTSPAIPFPMLNVYDIRLFLLY